MIATNLPAVRAALTDWFIAARAGDTMSAQDTAKLSAADAAAASSDFFFERLIEHSKAEVELTLAKANADTLVITKAGECGVANTAEPGPEVEPEAPAGNPATDEAPQTSFFG